MAAPIPPVLVELARARAAPAPRALPLPAGRDERAGARCTSCRRRWTQQRRARRPHVINLTLLPLSPEDVAHLDHLLDGGRW